MRGLIRSSVGAVVLWLAVMPGVSLGYANMVVLGDSLSDVGNLYLATQGMPGGPLPQDPPYDRGRFADGANYTETMWQALGLPGVIQPSFLGGSNYAVGGSRSRYHTFDRMIPGFDPLTTPTTVPQFTLLGQRDLLLFNSAGSLDASALYTVWIGSNDVADVFEAVAGGASMAVANQMLMQSANDLLSVIGDMVSAGARDFLVPTVPDIGRVPEVLALGSPAASALATALSQGFNDLVDLGLAGIGANITRLDVFGFLGDLIDDPTAFGLAATLNVSQPCFSGFVGTPGSLCADPGQHVFFDKIHPSALTHRVLGTLAANAVPAPGVLLLLAIGLLGFGARQRMRTAR